MKLVTLLVFSVLPAFAGYGDARDGLPAHEDRETFFWTNAVRLDPVAFRDAIPCNFDGFAASEKTPKAALVYNADLTEAAVYHSTDMQQDGYFDHDSNDGTSWDQRVYRYYSGGAIGENIAYGYPTPYDAVIGGWMCSSGHRANIMSAGYNELGAGVSGTYYTQDFGARGAAPDPAMKLGIHLPQRPSDEVTLYVDYSGNGPADALYVVLDGARHDLNLVIGADDAGVYGVTVPAGSGCQPYYFVAETGDAVETFPEDGSYGYGDCDWDDAGAGWLADQLPLPQVDPSTTDTGTPSDPGGDPDPTTDPDGTGGADDPDAADEAAAPLPEGCGCATSQVPTWALAALSLWFLRRRR